MKLHLDQKGMIPIIEIIILVGIIAIGGAIYYNHQKALETPGKDAYKVEVPAKKAVSKDSYLELKEWSLRLKLSESTKDLTYSYHKEGDFENIYFSSKSLIDAEAKYMKPGDSNSCEASHGPLGAVGKYKPGQSIFDIQVEKVPGAKTINGYVYVYEGPQATCSDHADVQKVQQPNLVRQLFDSGNLEQTK